MNRLEPFQCLFKSAYFFLTSTLKNINCWPFLWTAKQWHTLYKNQTLICFLSAKQCFILSSNKQEKDLICVGRQNANIFKRPKKATKCLNCYGFGNAG